MQRLRLIKILDLLIEAGWLAVIFFIPLIFSYWQANYSIFDLPKAILFCLLVELMLAAYVLKIFLENKISFKINNKIFLLSGLLLLSGFVSLFFSIHPLTSWQGSYERQQGVYMLLHYIVFFLIVILNLKNWQQIKRIIFVVLSSSAIVCLYGFLQYADLDFISWKKSAVYQGRIFSSFGQPNFLGHWLIMIIPLTFYSFFYVFRRNLSRFFVLLLLMAQILCLILTYSRAAWLGFIAEIFLFFSIFLIIFKKKILRLSLKNFLSAAILLIIIFVSLNVFCDNARPNKLVKRIASIAEISSNRLRLFYWRSALDEIKQMDYQRLLFGYGQESQPEIFVKYYQPEWAIYEKINTYPDRAHNAIFDIILTAGFIGFFIVSLFCCFIVLPAIKYIKYEKDNKEKWLAIAILIILGGYFINNLFSFSTTGAYIYLFLMLAIIVFFITEREAEKEISFSLLNNSSKALIFAAFSALIGITAFLYNIKPAIADYYFMEMDKAKTENDCLKVLENLNQTIKWHPANVFYQDKYIYNSLNCLSNTNSKETNLSVKNNIEEIISMAGDKELNYTIRVNIAHAYSLFGYYFDKEYYQKAEEIYQGLSKTNPYITAAYKDRGRMKLWQKDYGGAINLLEKELSVIPDLSKSFAKEHTQEIKEELIIFYDNLADAYFYKNDFDNALRYYKQALELNPYHLKLYKKIADIYYQQGNIDKAIWYNKRGMMLNPTDYVWPYSIALLYQEKGDDEKALEYAETALSLYPASDELKDFINKIK